MYISIYPSIYNYRIINLSVYICILLFIRVFNSSRMPDVLQMKLPDPDIRTDLPDCRILPDFGQHGLKQQVRFQSLKKSYVSKSRNIF